MNITSIKRSLESKHWYRQGGAAKLWYIGYPLLACYEPFTVRHRATSVCYNGMVSYVHDDYFEAYFPLSTMDRVARYYLRKQQKDHTFMQLLKKVWEQDDVAAFLKEVKKIEHVRLSTLSSEQLVKLHQEFSAVYMRLWREVIFSDAFDVVGDTLVEEQIKREKHVVTDEQIHILTAATELSWLQKEKSSLLQLVDAAKRDSKLSRFIKGRVTVDQIEIKFPQFYQALKAHAEAHHWIQNDYAVMRRLDVNFFLSNVRKFFTDDKLYQSEKESIVSVRKMLSKRERLTKRLRISSDTRRVLALLMTVAAWRDWRKAVNQIANSTLFLFARECAHRLHVPQHTFEYVLWWEVPQLFHASKPKQMKLLRLAARREKGSLYFDLASWRDSRRVLFGASARQLSEFFYHCIAQQRKELKGKSAFPGLAQGVVKIIRNQKDFAKMMQGDVLVASNTRPEYVPIMRRACAIITEEGGITSHAAIVSRELQIPCIVGMQGVLSALKDGEMVEVDAGNGVVKKLD